MKSLILSIPSVIPSLINTTIKFISPNYNGEASDLLHGHRCIYFLSRAFLVLPRSQQSAEQNLVFERCSEHPCQTFLALLCGDFAKLVLIALLIGTPVASFITHAFLSRYVVRTE